MSVGQRHICICSVLKCHKCKCTICRWAANIPFSLPQERRIERIWWVTTGQQLCLVLIPFSSQQPPFLVLEQGKALKNNTPICNKLIVPIPCVSELIIDVKSRCLGIKSWVFIVHYRNPEKYRFFLNIGAYPPFLLLPTFFYFRGHYIPIFTLKHTNSA